jgi:hypothetical protein
MTSTSVMTIPAEDHADLDEVAAFLCEAISYLQKIETQMLEARIKAALTSSQQATTRHARVIRAEIAEQAYHEAQAWFSCQLASLMAEGHIGFASNANGQNYISIYVGPHGNHRYILAFAGKDSRIIFPAPGPSVAIPAPADVTQRNANEDDWTTLLSNLSQMGLLTFRLPLGRQ